MIVRKGFITRLKLMFRFLLSDFNGGSDEFHVNCMCCSFCGSDNLSIVYSEGRAICCSSVKCNSCGATAVIKEFWKQ